MSNIFVTANNNLFIVWSC